MKHLTKNAAKCLACGDIVESKHRHDWRACKCGDIYVDGGLAYRHCGYKTAEGIQDMSEWIDDGVPDTAADDYDPA